MTSSAGGPPDPAPDPASAEARRRVAEAGADAVRRVSRRSTAWWRTPTAQGRTRAAAVADLVATLARATEEIEGTGDHGPPPHPPRDDVLADQLAVVTYDLALVVTPDAADRLLGTYARVVDEVDPRR